MSQIPHVLSCNNINRAILNGTKYNLVLINTRKKNQLTRNMYSGRKIKIIHTSIIKDTQPTFSIFYILQIFYTVTTVHNYKISVFMREMKMKLLCNKLFTIIITISYHQ